jgi:hypothetical protein
MDDEIFVSINKVDGGYIVHLNGVAKVTTSLNKAIKLVRDALNEDNVQEDEIDL